MEYIGVIGIVIALMAIMFLIIRGYNAIFASIVATLIVILTNQMPILETLVGSENSYVAQFGNFIIQNFMIFLLGSILAKFMEVSGATVSIANQVLKWFGEDSQFSVMTALFVISAILTYGGISMFVVVFAVIPMARPLFQRLNISWPLVSIPVFGGMATFTMSMLPGTPAMPNVLPSTSLGTPLTSEPVVSVIASILSAIFVLLYMKYELNRSNNRNEGYVEEDKNTENNVDINNIPSIYLSFLPIIVLIVIILLFSSISYIVILALFAAIMTATILFNPWLDSQKDTINSGIVGSFGSIMTTGNTIAFGGLLTAAPAFQTISDLILGIPGNPLISLSIATIVVSLVTGSAVATAGIAVESFAPTYLALGIEATVIHRVVSISSGIFGVMPHTGLIITFNEVAGLKLKDTFKYSFITVTGAHLAALLLTILLFNIL